MLRKMGQAAAGIRMQYVRVQSMHVRKHLLRCCAALLAARADADAGEHFGAQGEAQTPEAQNTGCGHFLSFSLLTSTLKTPSAG